MDWTLFLTFMVASGAAATTGAMFQPEEWYAQLRKPFWFPPRWVFPVVWTVLYVVMAMAAARVAVLPGNGQAMAFWAAQIALNTLWTPIFFGLHKMRAAMVVMVLLWLAVAATTWAFIGLDWIAGLMFVPYLIWVTAASALNWSSIQMNPEIKG